MGNIRIMVDLEALDTIPTAAIVSIGAVVFDIGGLGAEFYTPVDYKSCLKAGMTKSPDTVKWWKDQSKEAKAVLTDPDELSVKLSLVKLSKWIRTLSGTHECKNIEIWGNGANFDNVILSNAYRVCGLEQPWKFWNDRCYRTVSALVQTKRKQSGTHHNALDDAKSQAAHMVQILKMKTGGV